MIIKVCGMRDPDNIRAIEQTGIDWMGFDFNPKSDRYVSAPPSYLPKNVKRIGVFNNAPASVIINHVEDYNLDGIQLNGNETTGFCMVLYELLSQRNKRPILIKNINIYRGNDLNTCYNYERFCDCFLFNVECHTHEREIFYNETLMRYRGTTPFLLGGGITPNSRHMFDHLSHSYWIGIDLNAHFEIAPGIKDASLILHFLHASLPEKVEEWGKNQERIHLGIKN